MGVVYCLKRASDRELAMLQNRPKLIGRFLFDDDGAYGEQRPFSDKIKSFFKGNAAADDDVQFEEREEIDLDKSWHVLHFVLTGLSDDGEHPLNLIGRDWPRLANVDLGLGPPMGVSAASLRNFGRALDEQSNDQIMARWDSDAIRNAELYLGETLAEEGSEGEEYVLENLTLLRKFVSDCVAAGDGAVVYYS